MMADPSYSLLVRYFTKRASMSQINRALQYIEQNEEARWVKATTEALSSLCLACAWSLSAGHPLLHRQGASPGEPARELSSLSFASRGCDAMLCFGI